MSDYGPYSDWLEGEDLTAGERAAFIDAADSYYDAHVAGRDAGDDAVYASRDYAALCNILEQVVGR